MYDFAIQDHGSVVVFAPISDAALEKTEEFNLEPWQWLGKDRFAVDHRIADRLIEQLQAEGFSFT